MGTLSVRHAMHELFAIDRRMLVGGAMTNLAGEHEAILPHAIRCSPVSERS